MKFIQHPVRLALLVAVRLVAGAAPCGAARQAGRGHLLPGAQGRRQAASPRAPHRTEAMLKRAAPTNQWYSTLIFNPKPEALFVQPLTVKATPAGLELALPSKEVVPTERTDVEIHYPHRDPLVISPVAFEPGAGQAGQAPATGRSTSRWRAAPTTCGHRGPRQPLCLDRAVARRRARAAARRRRALRTPTPMRACWRCGSGGKAYALFGPTGVRWEQVSPTEWIGRLPAGKGYLSAAALPDDKAETLALFTRHAYAFLQDTRVDWRYDAAASKVETTFTATTQVMEGADNGPLLGLYPHQWFNNASVDGKLGPAYDTVRGKIRLLAAPQFKIDHAPTTASCRTGRASRTAPAHRAAEATC